jgi:transcription elongation factor Elf1
MKMPEGELRQYYDFNCAACGSLQSALPSWSMESGRNSGVGTCGSCGEFLHLEIAPENDRMISERWDDFVLKLQASLKVVSYE